MLVNGLMKTLKKVFSGLTQGFMLGNWIHGLDWNTKYCYMKTFDTSCKIIWILVCLLWLHSFTPTKEATKRFELVWGNNQPSRILEKLVILIYSYPKIVKQFWLPKSELYILKEIEETKGSSEGKNWG